MDIRIANASDADAISALIGSVMHHLTIDPAGHGAEAFIATMSPASIATTIAAPNMHYLVGFEGGVLAGAVALRDNRHLYHLFVAPAFQRRGLATRLWQAVHDHARAHGNPGLFTVNSSIHAVPLYEALGFRATGTRTEMNGIAFLPMQLDRTM
ncbi:GNAT family N-acetyltransferase [Pseudoduganella sp. GCM10020061]|uniref:GNAT family N-acetyltransferase n=1 Tax=Pseudoduganella sp. GCM10020061 TaxID=3317345 RepID=UPI00363A7F9D